MASRTTTQISHKVHPLVKDLMKRCILLKADHYDPQYFMQAVRREFQANHNLTNERDIMKAVAYGRWMIREEQGRIRFKQYRMLQQRYNPEFNHHPQSQFPSNQEQFHMNKNNVNNNGEIQYGKNNPFGKIYDEVTEMRKLQQGEE